MNNKTVLTLVLIAVMAVTACVQKNDVQQYDDESDFSIEPDADVSGGAAIVEYLGSKQEVRIPPRIQNLPVTSIGKYAFYGKGNITAVTIPDSVTSIGYDAFFRCLSLTSVNIPNGVTSIAYGAFFYTAITSVTIPDSVTFISEYAFAWCENLTAINTGSANSEYTSQDGVLYNKDKTVLFTYPSGRKGAFTIPDGVIIIGDRAFYRCENLIGATLPAGVTTIGNSAFEGCESLVSITIPNSVTSIGDKAFDYSGLTDITIPDIRKTARFT